MKCVKCGHDPDQPVVSRWELMIERDPPSLNQRIFNSGARSHVYRKERETWGWEIRSARMRNRVPLARASERRRVTMIRFYGGKQQERDVDNLAGGMKICVDTLVLEKLLIDDSPAFAELHYGQRRIVQGEVTGLSVLIEVLGEASP